MSNLRFCVVAALFALLLFAACAGGAVSKSAKPAELADAVDSVGAAVVDIAARRT